MRKWMRERMQRRKKKPTDQGSDPAPPPLQPAYFEGSDASDPRDDEALSSQAPERAVEKQAADENPAPAAEPPEASRQSGNAGAANRARGRRRRGGRGRGGKGREQAVAQAFTPAATKGIVPDTAPEGLEEQPEAAGTEPAGGASPVPQAPAAPVAVPAAAPRPPKGIVILAIGLPGSGKSSWFKRHNVTPLSSDMVRSLLFDDVREQRYQDLVFSNLRSMLKARLIAKRPMNYVDATNLTPQERQHWIKLAKDYNYEVHAVFFDVPLEVCIERHQRRDRVVPEDIMRRMAAKLKPPSFDEGFAKITVVRVKKKEQEPAEQAEA
jgi:predicted kinase